MKRFAVVSIYLVMVLMMVVGCVSTQWNNLTTDQKARIIGGGMQTQLSNLFDTGKAYVTANPQSQEVWKTKAIPAFDVANKTLLEGLKSAKSGTISPEDIIGKVQPLIDSLRSLLTAMGIKLPV